MIVLDGPVLGRIPARGLKVALDVYKGTDPGAGTDSKVNKSGNRA
jgi:hypothetical protein